MTTDDFVTRAEAREMFDRWLEQVETVVIERHPIPRERLAAAVQPSPERAFLDRPVGQFVVGLAFMALLWAGLWASSWQGYRAGLRREPAGQHDGRTS